MKIPTVDVVVENIQFCESKGNGAKAEEIAELRPIASIASGGEIARLMLALKCLIPKRAFTHLEANETIRCDNNIPTNIAAVHRMSPGMLWVAMSMVRFVAQINVKSKPTVTQ